MGPRLTGRAPRLILERWDFGEFELVVSPALIEELKRVVSYPRVKKLMREDADRDLLEALSSFAIHVDDPATMPPVKSEDPDDNYLIALAMAERAALVSGDRHLTDLRGTIPVFSPAEFLDYLPA